MEGSDEGPARTSILTSSSTIFALEYSFKCEARRADARNGCASLPLFFAYLTLNIRQHVKLIFNKQIHTFTYVYIRLHTEKLHTNTYEYIRIHTFTYVYIRLALVPEPGLKLHTNTYAPPKSGCNRNYIRIHTNTYAAPGSGRVCKRMYF